MRVGIDTYSYHRLLGWPREGEPAADAEPLAGGWAGVVGEARRLDVDFLSLQTMFLGVPEDVDAAAARAAAGPVELALSWGGMEGLRFGADRAAAAELERWLAFAPSLGARTVRIVVGGPALRGIEPIDAQLARVAPELRRASEVARRHGLTLAIENHGDLSAGELVELLERVGDPALRVCLDVANAIRVGDDPVAAAVALRPFVRMVHLRDSEAPTAATDPVAGPRVRPYGEGVVPLDAVLDALGDFDGPVCVELAQLGPGDDERALVAGGVGWLRARAAS